MGTDAGAYRPMTNPSGAASRRNFLGISLAGAVARFVTADLEFLAPGSALGQSSLTPEQALNQLIAGNRRFVAGRLTSLSQDLASLRTHTSEKQQPFAAVLACSDSRVPVELIFDQTIGQIFVARVAGNIVTSEIIASLEYGAQVLGTRVILIMGHGSCGAVEATMHHKDAPGQISALYPHIQPAIDKAGTDLDAAIKANALIQSALLRQSSTVVSGLVHGGNLKVIAAYYNIGSGVVSLLE